jgi:hypothetical protein
MMTREKAVRRAEDFEEAVRGMKEAGSRQEEQVDVELTAKISTKDKREDGILYLEPAIRIPTGGNKHPEMEKQRSYLYEWVKGVYENKLIGGEGIEFFLTGLPGDDYCLWKIPANRPVALPRYVAQHLSKGLQWKEPKPLAATQEPRAYHDYEIMRPFEDVVVKKRGTFSPLNAY